MTSVKTTLCQGDGSLDTFLFTKIEEEVSLFKHVFPKIECTLILRSDQDMNLEIYDCLKSIQCDRIRTLRACEATHPMYGIDDDGVVFVWKGTEFIMEFAPLPCNSLKKAMDEVIRRIEPYLEQIHQMIHEYQLSVVLVYKIVTDIKLEYPYPEMTITRKMMSYLYAIGAEIQIVMEDD